MHYYGQIICRRQLRYVFTAPRVPGEMASGGAGSEVTKGLKPDTATAVDDEAKDENEFLSPNKVPSLTCRGCTAILMVGGGLWAWLAYYALVQADEVAQSDYQKKYGFVNKPLAQRKVSQVSHCSVHSPCELGFVL